MMQEKGAWLQDSKVLKKVREHDIWGRPWVADLTSVVSRSPHAQWQEKGERIQIHGIGEMSECDGKGMDIMIRI